MWARSILIISVFKSGEKILTKMALYFAIAYYFVEVDCYLWRYYFYIQWHTILIMLSFICRLHSIFNMLNVIATHRPSILRKLNVIWFTKLKRCIDTFQYHHIDFTHQEATFWSDTNVLLRRNWYFLFSLRTVKTARLQDKWCVFQPSLI